MQRSSKRSSSSNLTANKNEDSSVKRAKKSAAPSQTNTLLNYFGSNHKQEPKSDEPKQSSLLTYFKSENKLEPSNSENVKSEIKQSVKNEVVPTDSVDENSQIIAKHEPKLFAQKQSKPETKSEESKSFMSLFKPVKTTEVKHPDPAVEPDYQTPSSNTSNKENRKCPFYKRIESEFTQLYFLEL